MPHSARSRQAIGPDGLHIERRSRFRLLPWGLRRRGCVLHRVRVLGADEGDDLPKIVRGLDDPAERRHRADHDLGLHALVALLLKLIRTKGDQAEQRVVVSAIDEGVVGKRRTHATTTAAVAPHEAPRRLVRSTTMST